MKVDFNGSGFSASMNENDGNATEKMFDLSGQKTLKNAIIPITGGLALFFAILLIPLGFFSNTAAQFLLGIFDVTYVNFMSMYIFSLVILFSLSLVLSILSMALRKRGDNDTVKTVGLVLSVTAIPISTLGLIYNVLILITTWG